MTLDRRIGIVLLAAVLPVTACSRRQPPQQPAPVEDTQAPTRPTEPPPAPPIRSNGNDEAIYDENLRILQTMVFFDYDRSDIRSDAAQVLNQKMPILRQNTAIRMRIDGHADERGSVEYNLALGMRRAEATKAYLVGFGLDPARFETRTLGEDQPADRGTSEAAYARNRRAEFTITAGMTGR
jgi:peptidoglycan-associated lipoprotein